jgi:hypothetical protein
VSIHEGIIEATEPSDRVLASICRGLHAIGPIIDCDDEGYLLFDRPLQEGGTRQLEEISSRTTQHRRLHLDVL